MNGADVVAEILRREGTDFLSAYPRNPLIESCAALNIRPIFCRQERVGVGLADGYSRIKRGKKNGVFAAQAGPGWIGYSVPVVNRSEGRLCCTGDTWISDGVVFTNGRLATWTPLASWPPTTSLGTG